MRKVLLSMLLLLLLTPAVASAGQVCWVVMDGINLEHLTDPRLENFQLLLNQGSVGLANANTAGGRTPGNTAITLGAGSRALGPGAQEVFSSTQQLGSSLAREILARRIGVLPPKDSLVLPSIAEIHHANSELLHPVEVGYLANTLAQADKLVAAIVNADDEEVNRAAAAIVADANGIIAQGSVEDLVQQHGFSPFGIAADFAAWQQALDTYSSHNLLVIDLGDTGRLREYAHLASEGRVEDFRMRALTMLDQALGEILARQQPGDLLLVTGLQADGLLASEESKLLVPVLAYGQGFGPGLLTSDTTRRPGVVANFDATATILQHFDLHSADTYSQPMTYIQHQDPAGYLLQREAEMARIYRLRAPVVKVFIAAIIVVVALAVAALALKWKRVAWIRIALLALLVVPLVLLITGAIPGSPWLLPVGLGLVVVLAGVFHRLSPQLALKTLGAATAIVILVDALLGAYLQQRSLLGYDAIAGARYYGIGNEYMGVLLGCTLLVVACLVPRRRWLAGIIFALVSLALMLPGVGANFGGFLSALIAAIFCMWGLSALTDKKNRQWAVLVALGGLIFLVWSNFQGQSHVGRFILALLQHPDEFWLTVRRKLDMAWRLVRWSLWSRAFVVLLVASLWLVCSQRQRLARKLGDHWPQVRGAMAAAVAVFVLNDSGVVAAATSLLFLTLPLLYYQLSSNSWSSDSQRM